MTRMLEQYSQPIPLTIEAKVENELGLGCYKNKNKTAKVMTLKNIKTIIVKGETNRKRMK